MSKIQITVSNIARCRQIRWEKLELWFQLTYAVDGNISGIFGYSLIHFLIGEWESISLYFYFTFYA